MIAAKGGEPQAPQLTAPLSKLTGNQQHIPVKDMEAWASRPAEDRRREAEKNNGHITRPMNSFMMYRSAYAERAKLWCSQNNHKVVASLAGQSWRMETPEVRDLYNEYAKIEQINHKNAHPTYSFSPRKRKDEWPDEEPSDLNDSEWAPNHGRRSRQAKRCQRSTSYIPNSDSLVHFGRPFDLNTNSMMRSSWEMTNEGRPMPIPMDRDKYKQYYQTVVYPNAHMGAQYGEDLRLRRVGMPVAAPAPALQFCPNLLLGLPGGDASHLMNQLQPELATPYEEGQNDPLLLAYDGGHLAEVDPVVVQQDYRNGYSNIIPDHKYDQQEIDRFLEMEHAHESYHSTWQSDPTMSSLDQESEFDKWVGEH
ncbi:hypothetical protein N0V95_009983 [Ascochyta clinopodiicola]|nr:hypothetical protein N0V95_009983 [Ascochyta clinopodiicola]